MRPSLIGQSLTTRNPREDGLLKTNYKKSILIANYSLELVNPQLLFCLLFNTLPARIAGLTFCLIKTKLTGLNFVSLPYMYDIHLSFFLFFVYFWLHTLLFNYFSFFFSFLQGLAWKRTSVRDRCLWHEWQSSFTPSFVLPGAAPGVFPPHSAPRCNDKYLNKPEPGW